MRFNGRVWFSFANPSVWQFYTFVLALAREGNSVGLEWVPFYEGDERDAMATFVSLPSPQERGRFLHAMLGLVHIDKMDPGESSTVAAALRAAACDTPTGVDVATLEEIAEKAAELGVHDTPALFTGGPTMHVVMNEAAASGDVEATAAAVLAVLESDGIWRLAKP